MVLVDTSVWISLYRKETHPIGELIWSLVAKNEAALCGQVLVEFVGGFRKEKDRLVYERLFEGFPFFETNLKAYKIASRLSGSAGIGVGDSIIAATAIEWEIPLLTLDKAFHKIRNLKVVPL